MLRDLSDASRIRLAAMLAAIPALLLASRRSVDRPLTIGLVAGIVMSVAISLVRGRRTAGSA